jgi:hypothetical protein
MYNPEALFGLELMAETKRRDHLLERKYSLQIPRNAILKEICGTGGYLTYPLHTP